MLLLYIFYFNSNIITYNNTKLLVNSLEVITSLRNYLIATFLPATSIFELHNGIT